MLSHLHISNFTLVDSLDIELNQGLTALTGETGAGKSILLGALALTLGDRADADKVRAGADRADIHASFDISNLPYARKWLKEHDLGEEQECILRRVVTKEGRSRAYINGKTVPLNQLRHLGEILIDIHSQHEHQSLLKPSTHRRLLDDFAGTQSLSKRVKECFFHWKKINDELTNVQEISSESDARFQLLSYQVTELDQLDLEETELEALEKEQKELSNSELATNNCEQAIDLCSNESTGIGAQLHHAVTLLNQLKSDNPTILNAESLLNTAIISIDEAKNDLSHFVDNFNADPQRLFEVENRLSDIYSIARKHKIPTEELFTFHHQLKEELSTLSSSDEKIAELEQAAKEAEQKYQKEAENLSSKRRRAAKKLSKAVNDKLTLLAMGHAVFTVEVTSDNHHPTANGNDTTEFLISTQPDQPPKPLQKVASGGELSRISLAIQVITAQTSTIPTLVFDEVDVGIGGTTGDVVGKMLRELGSDGQVFCVTHLPQVASKAHCHLKVEKTINKKQANSELVKLEGEAKVEEIARMMGGTIDSEQSLAHAREILDLGLAQIH